MNQSSWGLSKQGLHKNRVISRKKIAKSGNLLRHIVTGSSGSMALVALPNLTDDADVRLNVRAVFHSAGEGRRKVSFACDAEEFSSLVSILEQGAPGERAKLSLAGSRGSIEATAHDSGLRKIRFMICASRTRTGTNGVVVGKYRAEPVGSDCK